MSNYICECGVSNIDSAEGYVQGCDCHVNDKTPEERTHDLIGDMTQICRDYHEMKERMAQVEVWFQSVGDRLGTIEKRVCGMSQALKIWVDGRGGRS